MRGGDESTRRGLSHRNCKGELELAGTDVCRKWKAGNLVRFCNYTSGRRNCFMNFCQKSYEVLTPLMYSTSIPVGGLGLSPYEIGWIMFAWGTVNAILQVFLISTLIRKPRTFITSIFFPLGSFFTFSFESYFARKAGYIDWRVMTLMVIHMAFKFFISSAYGARHVLVVQSATNRETLGSTNGLAQTFNSCVRGFAPSIASSLFSVTLQKNLAGGFMVYIVFWVLISIGVKLSMHIPKSMTVSS